ncbi:hypothetical protein BDEG_24485 [Batrachochytrium dendrobatidis JEL423]|uniref:Uncharacterized protein n=1 Tax=Batrachochytrium dendrobatidis (strain JEL423) TaxID=403673 RepID=A0A177WL10_BATDL|nr:hypothetical protein BDEG_24479 [Batrachochytrium dendrobatidis JEL423]OAJ40784.1 hypothetical protein BDEG_24485 [Batrachochytrium dendrobatidis JEL423]
MKQAVIFVISLLTAMSSAIVVSTSESPAPTLEPSPSTSSSTSTSTSTPDPDPLFQSHSDTHTNSLFLHYNTLLEQYNSKTAECENLKQDCEKLDKIVHTQTLVHICTLAKCNRDRDSSAHLRLKATSNYIKEKLKKVNGLYLQSLAKKIHICREASQLKARMNDAEAKIQNLLPNDQQ